MTNIKGNTKSSSFSFIPSSSPTSIGMIPLRLVGEAFSKMVGSSNQSIKDDVTNSPLIHSTNFEVSPRRKNSIDESSFHKLTNWIPIIPQITNLVDFTLSVPSKIAIPIASLFSSKIPPVEDSKLLVVSESQYQTFLLKLELDKHGKSLRDNMNRFIHDFLESLPSQEPLIYPFPEETIKDEVDDEQFAQAQGRRVQTFIDAMIEDYCPLIWTKKQIEENEILECLEKYIMEKIYHRTFALSNKDLTKDMKIYNRILSLHFIGTNHLDIPLVNINEDKWTSAQEELLNINSFKSPQEKLHTLLHCSKYLFEMLRENSPGKSFSADEFLPMFIYIILKTNPPCLHSNIKYLSNFRHPSKMLAETGYYFVSFVTAVSFIENMDSSLLSNIDPSEFEKGINSNHDVFTPTQKEKGKTTLTIPAPFIESIVEGLSTREIHHDNENSNNRENITNYSSEYFLTKSPSEYKIEDIRALLADYERVLSLINNSTTQKNTTRVDQT